MSAAGGSRRSRLRPRTEPARTFVIPVRFGDPRKRAPPQGWLGSVSAACLGVAFATFLDRSGRGAFHPRGELPVPLRALGRGLPRMAALLSITRTAADAPDLVHERVRRPPWHRSALTGPIIGTKCPEYHRSLMDRLGNTRFENRLTKRPTRANSRAQRALDFQRKPRKVRWIQSASGAPRTRQISGRQTPRSCVKKQVPISGSRRPNGLLGTRRTAQRGDRRETGPLD
jgi:hypothetical protein